MDCPMEECLGRCTLAAPDRILAVTDLANTDWLVPHIVAQVKAGGARVTIVQIFPPVATSLPASTTVRLINDMKVIRDARLALLCVARQIESEGVPCDAVVRSGDPVQIIAEMAAQVEATRILVGTHKGASHTLLGAVTHPLIEKVDLPVFVVDAKSDDIV